MNPRANPDAAGGRRRSTVATITVFALVGISVWALALAEVGRQRDAMDARLRAQALELADGRAALLATWLEGIRQIGYRITRSELVQVYAESRTGGGSPPAWVIDQEPYIAQLLGELMAQHDLMGAALVGPEGEILLSSGAGPDASSARAAGSVGPLREVVAPGIGSDLAFDLVLPVRNARDGASATSGGSGFLVMTARAGQALDVLARRSGAVDVPEAHLVQSSADAGATWILDGAVRPVPAEVAADLDLAGARVTIAAIGGRQVFAATVRVPDSLWTVLQVLDRSVVEAALWGLQSRAFAAAGIATVLLAIACALLLRRRRQQDLRLEEARAREEAELAVRVRGIVETIAAGVSDGVGFKDPDGRYVFGNPALGQALGQRPDQIVGRTDADLPSSGTALHDPGRRALTARPGGQAVSIPLAGTEGAPSGALVLAPAQSLPAEAAVKSGEDTAGMLERSVFSDGAIAVLVRAGELRDPFLTGHTERLTALAVAVGRELGLDDASRASLEIAARLSQVGKIFIPDPVLTKPARHTAEEEEIMQSHIVRALDLLQPAGLDADVLEALSGMHERLDGSGYPDGLRGPEIGILARVLAACDVFCARTAPRAYRDQVAPGRALYYLAGHPERYDAEVVSALLRVAARDRGRQSPALPAPSGMHSTADAA